MDGLVVDDRPGPLLGGLSAAVAATTLIACCCALCLSRFPTATRIATVVRVSLAIIARVSRHFLAAALVLMDVGVVWQVAVALAAVSFIANVAHAVEIFGRLAPTAGAPWNDDIYAIWAKRHWRGASFYLCCGVLLAPRMWVLTTSSIWSAEFWSARFLDPEYAKRAKQADTTLLGYVETLDDLPGAVISAVALAVVSEQEGAAALLTITLSASLINLLWSASAWIRNGASSLHSVGQRQSVSPSHHRINDRDTGKATGAHDVGAISGSDAEVGVDGAAEVVALARELGLEDEQYATCALAVSFAGPRSAALQLLVQMHKVRALGVSQEQASDEDVMRAIVAHCGRLHEAKAALLDLTASAETVVANDTSEGLRLPDSTDNGRRDERHRSSPPLRTTLWSIAASPSSVGPQRTISGGGPQAARSPMSHQTEWSVNGLLNEIGKDVPALYGVSGDTRPGRTGSDVARTERGAAVAVGGAGGPVAATSGASAEESRFPGHAERLSPSSRSISAEISAEPLLRPPRVPPTATHSSLEPAREELQTLTAMGFSESAAAAALERSGGDVVAAAELLLPTAAQPAVRDGGTGEPAGSGGRGLAGSSPAPAQEQVGDTDSLKVEVVDGVGAMELQGSGSTAASGSSNLQLNADIEDASEESSLEDSELSGMSTSDADEFSDGNPSGGFSTPQQPVARPIAPLSRSIRRGSALSGFTHADSGAEGDNSDMDESVLSPRAAPRAPPSGSVDRMPVIQREPAPAARNRGVRAVAEELAPEASVGSAEVVMGVQTVLPPRTRRTRNRLQRGARVVAPTVPDPRFQRGFGSRAASVSDSESESESSSTVASDAGATTAEAETTIPVRSNRGVRAVSDRFGAVGVAASV